MKTDNNTIAFSYNWNNKLNSKIGFTTIRLHNPSKYVVNSTYEIRLVSNGEIKKMFNANIFSIKEIKLADIDDYIAYLDTGYNAEKTRDIIKKMYLKSQINWDTQLLDYLLLVKINEPIENLLFDNPSL